MSSSRVLWPSATSLKHVLEMCRKFRHHLKWRRDIHKGCFFSLKVLRDRYSLRIFADGTILTTELLFKLTWSVIAFCRSTTEDSKRTFSSNKTFENLPLLVIPAANFTLVQRTDGVPCQRQSDQQFYRLGYSQ